MSRARRLPYQQSSVGIVSVTVPVSRPNPLDYQVSDAHTQVANALCGCRQQAGLLQALS